MVVKSKEFHNFTRDELEYLRKVINQLGRWRFLNAAYGVERDYIVRLCREGKSVEEGAGIVAESRITLFRKRE